MIFCYECKWISRWGTGLSWGWPTGKVYYHSLQDKYVLHGWRAGLEVVRLAILRPLRAVLPWLALALALVATFHMSYQWSAARARIETRFAIGGSDGRQR